MRVVIKNCSATLHRGDLPPAFKGILGPFSIFHPISDLPKPIHSRLSRLLKYLVRRSASERPQTL